MIVFSTGCSIHRNKKPKKQTTQTEIDYEKPYKLGLKYVDYFSYLQKFGFISIKQYTLAISDQKDTVGEIKITPDTEYIVNTFNEAFFTDTKQSEQVKSLLLFKRKSTYSEVGI